MKKRINLFMLNSFVGTPPVQVPFTGIDLWGMEFAPRLLTAAKYIMRLSTYDSLQVLFEKLFWYYRHTFRFILLQI